MWIEIKKDIFEGIDFRGLNFLIQLLTWHPSKSIPRYNIFVNIEGVKHLNNYKNLTEIDKKVLETEFDEASMEGIRSGRYIVTNKNKNQSPFRLNIEEAIMFLTQPIYILIENSLNDSYFLKAIFHHFDEKLDNDKQVFTEFVKNNWIEFINAGGWGNIKNCVRGKLLSYNLLAAENGKDNSSYFRCFVMVDSDKTYPNETIDDKEKLKKELEVLNIKVHILKKRAMENYMPDEVIDKIPMKKGFKQFRSWVETYKELNQEQKDYLNYRDGFSKGKTNRVELDINVQNLYPLIQINDIDFVILDEGLKQFPSNFKNYFPTLFENNPLVHKRSLLNREGGTDIDNEFLDIITAIKDLL